jgi:hypothetical protein
VLGCTSASDIARKSHNLLINLLVVLELSTLRGARYSPHTYNSVGSLPQVYAEGENQEEAEGNDLYIVNDPHCKFNALG